MWRSLRCYLCRSAAARDALLLSRRLPLVPDLERELGVCFFFFFFCVCLWVRVNPSVAQAPPPPPRPPHSPLISLIQLGLKS